MRGEFSTYLTHSQLPQGSRSSWRCHWRVQEIDGIAADARDGRPEWRQQACSFQERAAIATVRLDLLPQSCCSTQTSAPYIPELHWSVRKISAVQIFTLCGRFGKKMGVRCNHIPQAPRCVRARMSRTLEHCRRRDMQKREARAKTRRHRSHPARSFDLYHPAGTTRPEARICQRAC
jgi:hypothetical protein